MVTRTRLIRLGFALVNLGLVQAASLLGASTGNEAVCDAIMGGEKEYARSQEVKVSVRVVNRSETPVFLLTEDSAGLPWIDRENHRVVLAHYAFTQEREKALRGGWTTKRFYRPQFYRVEPGSTLALEWNLGTDLGPGTWTIEGKLSVQADVSAFAEAEGSEVRESMAEQDSVVSCQKTTIVIEQ